MPNKESIPGLGLFFGILEANRRPQVLWQGSTWHSEISSWDLLLKILSTKDKSSLEEVGWNFLPLIMDEIEIYALTKLFQISGIGEAYLIIYHQSPEKLTFFLLQQEEKITKTFEDIFNSSFYGKQLSNEQLKQIRIKSQSFYEILSVL
ncbi:MAG: hypothetical protein ACW97X_07000 [Candidatus Hodarchaeales archaeon]|jgi:hypothetical protein